MLALPIKTNLKITLRSNAYLIFVAVGVILTAFMTAVVVWMFKTENIGDSVTEISLTTPATMCYIIPLALGAYLITIDFGKRSIATSLLGLPNRKLLVLERLLVTAISCFICAVIMTLIALVTIFVCTPLFLEQDFSEVISSLSFSTLVQVIVSLWLWGIFGFGAGLLIQSLALVLGIFIGFTQVVEPILNVALPMSDFGETLTRFLPGTITEGIVGESIFTIAYSITPLNAWQAFLLLILYTVVVVAVGTFRFIRQDF